MTRKNNVLMIVYAHLPYDSRVKRAANALERNGYHVDIICLKDKNQPSFEVMEGNNIYRLNIVKSRTTKSRYIRLYTLFFIRAFIKSHYLWLKHRYKVLHVHNMPDFLVFVGLLLKLFGIKLILDIHDPSPEVFMTKFNSDDFLIKLIKLQEKMSIGFADKVITTNEAFVKTFTKRGYPAHKFSIIMNTPDPGFFKPDNMNSQNQIPDTGLSKFILMYHGLMVERHGLDTAVQAVNLLKEKIPQIEFWIFGGGEFTEKILKLINELSLEDTVKYFGRVNLQTIAGIIPKISVGIIPNKIGPFISINFPTRIFEYLYFRKPVIVPKTEGITDYFDENSIIYFKSGSITNLAEVIYEVYQNKNKVEEIVSGGYEVFYNNRWEIQSKKLLELYNTLISE